MAICSPIASPWSPSERKWTPAKLRPRAAFEASLFNSPTIVSASGERASRALHFSAGHGSFSLLAPCVFSIALRTVTHAPATVACPAGHAGCVGLPSGYCVARSSVLLFPSRPVKSRVMFLSPCRNSSYIGRSQGTLSHLARLFLQNSRRPPTASGRMRMACCHLCHHPALSAEIATPTTALRRSGPPPCVNPEIVEVSEGPVMPRGRMSHWKLIRAAL
eukprot:scaffold50862_cov65-Phaeocystis_antarctica.AAC.5